MVFLGLKRCYLQAIVPKNPGAATRISTGLKTQLADAEFGSDRNHFYVRQQLRADSVISASRGERTWRIQEVRASVRSDFPTPVFSHLDFCASKKST